MVSRTNSVDHSITIVSFFCAVYRLGQKDLSYSLTLVHLNPFQLVWAEIECTVHSALLKWLLNQFKPVQKIRQAPRANCLNIYTVPLKPNSNWKISKKFLKICCKSQRPQQWPSSWVPYHFPFFDFFQYVGFEFYPLAHFLMTVDWPGLHLFVWSEIIFDLNWCIKQSFQVLSTFFSVTSVVEFCWRELIGASF